MSLITRTAKGSKLTIAEMDGNLTYLEQLAQQGGGLEGTQYLFVAADGTDVENAAELQEAYDAAKTMSPSADNRITVVAAPGTYKFPSTFVMDTEFIDLVSLTGNRDVIFDLDGITDPFQYDDDTFDIISIGECLLIDIDNVFVKGIKGKFYLSPNWDAWNGMGEDYILPISIGDNLPNILVENCEGGPFSFAADFTFGSNPILLSGTFINCKAGHLSFGIYCEASGTFIDCQGLNEAFGYYSAASGLFINCIGENNLFGVEDAASGTFKNCIGDVSCFGINDEASGTFYNCIGGDNSFGGFGTASGTFTDCIGGNSSFGGDGGTASGTFTDCIGGDSSFGSTSTGTFTNCQGGDRSFGGQGEASGEFTNCQGGFLSFGENTASGIFNNCTANTGFGTVTLSGKLFYCRLTSGTFETVSGGGVTVLCIDGNNAINTQN